MEEGKYRSYVLRSDKSNQVILGKEHKTSESHPYQ